MIQTIIFTVNSVSRLDEFLREKLPSALQTDKPLSNSKIRRLVFSGNIFVNNATVKNPAFVLRQGARLKISCDTEKLFYEKPAGDIEFALGKKNIIYEDEYIIVVNKPCGLPTEGSFVKERASLYVAVVEYLKSTGNGDKPYCGIVHRLDKGTSGVILFSKSAAVNKALHEAFASEESIASQKRIEAAPSSNENGSMPQGIASPERIERAAKKTYLAVCTRVGQPSGSAGEASVFLRRASNSKGFAKPLGVASPTGMEASPTPCGCGTPAASMPNGFANNNFSVQNYLGRVSPKSQAAKFGEVPQDKGGKFARTDFRVLKEEDGKVLIQAELVTGRTHQIRVHLSQSGLPILGDTLYGGQEAERIYLHSHSLELPHPITHEPMKFVAELPQSFPIK